MSYQHISVEPIAGALGAEIRGVDLASEIDAATFDEIRRAYHDRLAVFFPGQALSPAAQAAFAGRFGPLIAYPYVEGFKEAPNVIEIRKTPEDSYNFGGLWHTDMTYTEQPPGATVLFAKELPPSGGDTIFGNAHAAYDALSSGMKEMLAPLSAVNSAGKRYGGGRTKTLKETTSTAVKEDVAVIEAVHPVIRTHPETGRKMIYVSFAHTVRFTDMTEAESAPILNFLYDHLTRPEFTCRFRWTEGALAMWDNRCVQHFAINDYPNDTRAMNRCTVAGERPV